MTTRGCACGCDDVTLVPITSAVSLADRTTPHLPGRIRLGDIAQFFGNDRLGPGGGGGSSQGYRWYATYYNVWFNGDFPAGTSDGVFQRNLGQGGWHTATWSKTYDQLMTNSFRWVSSTRPMVISDLPTGSGWHPDETFEEAIVGLPATIYHTREIRTYNWGISQSIALTSRDMYERI